MRPKLNYKIISSFAAIFSAFTLSYSQSVIALDGIWSFRLENASSSAKYGPTISLPGTMDQASYGYPSAKADIDNQWTFGWRRPFVYEGVAIYEREIDIPKSWEGKTVQLFIEQTRGETLVSIDDKVVSEPENSLVTSHTHVLGTLKTGKHKLSVRLDNSHKYGIGGSYIRSAMGQGNWNGMVGRLELRCKESSYIENVVFTPFRDNTAQVEFECAGRTPDSYSASVYDGSRLVAEVSGRKPLLVLDISGLELWDEFNPKCYTLKSEIKCGSIKDVRTETVGVRFIESNDKHQFCVNGRPIFLRGTVSYNIFPLTGYPSTDMEDWEKTFSIYKQWGMNHVRFHSLTPPEAALEAADRLGVYLQCEAPKAGRVGKADEDEFHINEGRRIIHDYGNHPSFILMSMGNELAGSIADIQNVYDKVTAGDIRRLHTTTTGSSKTELKDEFKIYGGIVRGFKGPFTNWDYSKVAKEINQTMLSHEVGQWNTFPDVGIINKYTGVMRPDNLELVRDELARKGFLDKAGLFTQTTGKFAALLFKDEMEAIMRTPDYGGYQILMLNDFPAQGTATSGMIDIFNDEKGYITPGQFREYCAPVVPLLRIEKRTFSNKEILRADLDLSCYTALDLPDARLNWCITDGDNIYQKGSVDAGTVKTGNVYPVGKISADLSSVKESSALQIVVDVEGTEYKNRWNIWVYACDEEVAIPSDIYVTSSWSAAKTALSKGEKVLFFAAADELAKWRPGQFKTIFWSPIWLKRGVETMSVLADTQHPALKKFPTAEHTDWQWFSILENSLSFSIDELPADLNPIIGLIDSYRKNQRLANTIECSVGKGRLLMTTIDLMRKFKGDVARENLRKSIVDYMVGDEFKPSCKLEIEDLDKLFTKTVFHTDALKADENHCPIVLSADGSKKQIKKGYACKISSKVQKSGMLSAWADKRDIDIKITAPKNTSGILHLFLRNSTSTRWGMLKTPQEIAEVDWVEETFVNYGNKKPVCCVIVNGEYVQTLNDFGTTGHWYDLPVEASYLQNGEMTVRLSTFNFPNILTDLVFETE